jgi:hypothetical protein
MTKHMKIVTSPTPGRPKAGSIPSGDRSMYASDEGLS